MLYTPHNIVQTPWARRTAFQGGSVDVAHDGVRDDGEEEGEEEDEEGGGEEEEEEEEGGGEVGLESERERKRERARE